MSDVALQNAIALRDELTAACGDLAQKIADLSSQKADTESRLTKVSAFISDWYAYAGGKSPDVKVDLNALSPADFGIHDDDKKHVTRVAGNPKKELVAAEALEIIRQSGRPIPRAELYEALKGRGVIVNGNDPLVTFSTMLWRMKPVIMHLQGFGYWDPALPYADADYAPENAITPSDDDLFDADLVNDARREERLLREHEAD
ncbi:MAG: hypothetical protein ACLPIC_20945 [Rhodoblastus sp.]|uniref:hypothetical protein n=1 Tax=Rhodoblastus sp. TaxID=1962975 RepID=UPI003F97EBC2